MTFTCWVCSAIVPAEACFGLKVANVGAACFSNEKRDENDDLLGSSFEPEAGCAWSGGAGGGVEFPED